MQVLLRMYDGKYYVWKEAKHERNTFIIDGSRWSETDIIAVRGEEGKKYVRCKYCNEQIDNTPEAIEKHFVEWEAKRDCTKCRDMRLESKSLPERSFVKNEEGRYEVTEKYTASISCTLFWGDPESETGKAFCKFNQHRKQGVEAIGGILMQYPDLFEKQITVEALKANDYHFENRWNGFFSYDMNLRNTLYAYVNECGIVDHFEASYRGTYRTFYYSATQKKLFYAQSGCYKEGIPSNWSENKYKQVRRKIEALYKEDNAK